MAGIIQRGGGRRHWRAAATVLAIALWAISQTPLAAHDIPASVVVQVFAKPEGQTLHVLLRVPLLSMRDVTFTLPDGVFLDTSRLDARLEEAARTWILPGLTLYADGQRLDAPAIAGLRVAPASDRSFASYDEALAHFRSPPIPPDAKLPVAESLFDVMLEYPITSDRVQLAINPEFARFGLRVVTTLRFQIPGQPERAFQFTGDPGLVRLDPRWYHAAARFVHAGFLHILDGIDHLLFLFCLVLPLRRFWELFKVISAFTAAHSITLFCSAFGWAPDGLWFPPLIETLIAISILYMSLENIVVSVNRWRGGTPTVAAPADGAILQRRWMIAFGFGLVHGFGFAFALRETLQFAGSHLVTSLLSFNVGVELGQLLVLAIVLPVLAVIFRRVIDERLGIIIASALVAHTAWHWMADRFAVLRQYDLWPSGPADVASLLRWVMVGVAVVGALWLMGGRKKR